MINFVKGIDLAPEIQKRFCIDESNFSEINLYESGLVFPEVFGDRQKFDIILADFGINS